MLSICPICSGSSTSSIFKVPDQPLARYGLCVTATESSTVKCYPIDIHICEHCGVMFNNSFDFGLVDYTSEKVQESRIFSPSIHAYMNAKYEELSSLINLKGSEVLEIGCGEGFFLSKFNENCITQAFEPSTEGKVASASGINVLKEYFDPLKIDYNLNPKLIILRQVLEHLKQPQLFFDSFVQLLRKNNEQGYLYIEVPNSNTTLKHNRFYDYYFEHYLYFTTASLSLLAEQAGFTVKYCKEEFNDEIISMLCEVKSSTQTSSSHFELKLDKMRNVVSDIVANGKKIVAWGTAGSGSSLLNMCGLDSGILPYVIDSDLRKQGHYMPGTGQFIVKPDFFVQDPPDAVLILSQFHKKDIIKQIHELYGPNVQIIVPDDV
jgi:hypothetical protein